MRNNMALLAVNAWNPPYSECVLDGQRHTRVRRSGPVNVQERAEMQGAEPRVLLL